MNYITITTPDNIEVEYRLSGAGSRIAAAIIDTIIQAVLYLVVSLILYYTFLGGSFSNISKLNNVGWAVGLLILFCFSIYFGYYIISELLFNGQTIGKKLFKLRVIRENGAPISLTQSLIRNVFKFFIDTYGVGVVLIMFSKKCKRIGDMAASTIVVSENPNQIQLTGLNASELLSNGEESHMNSYGDNFKLALQEQYLLKDYFNRKSTFLDNGESALKSLIKYFSKKFGIPQEKLSESILSEILKLQ